LDMHRRKRLAHIELSTGADTIDRQYDSNPLRLR